jgi:hypothetical protein
MNNLNILFAIFILSMPFASIASASIAPSQSKNDNNITSTDAGTSLTAAYAQLMQYNDNNMIIIAKLEEPFQLTINQTAVVTANNMTVQFLDVPQDSRCPAFVTCIWAGQVIVSLNISKFSSVPLIFNLTLMPSSASNSSAIGLDGYNLKLLQIEPYPIKDEEIAKSDYRATFVIAEG